MRVRTWIAWAPAVLSWAALATCGESSAPKPPDFTISATSVAFAGVQLGPNPATKTVAIVIVGEGTLDWAVTDNAPWLTVAPASGTGAATITISVDIAGLSAGNHTAVVTFSAAGSVSGTKTANVTLALETAPRILLSADTLYFAVVLGDTVRQSKTIQVTNGGGGTLNWAASTTTSWLSLSPSSGTGAGSITVTVNPALNQNPPGTVVPRVTVSATRAANSPSGFSVSLTTRLPPLMSITPSAVFVTLRPGDSVMTAALLVDVNQGTYGYAASNSRSWLRLVSGIGMAPDSLRLRVSAAGLTEGEYRDTVVVSAPGASNSPRRLPVSLTVRAATLNAQTYVFKSVAPNDSATTKLPITNTGGGGPLGWTAAKRASWLGVTASGVTPDTVRLTFNTTGLAEGSYADTVRITSPSASNSPFSIIVSLFVSKPTISLVSFVSQQMRRNDTATRKLPISSFGGGIGAVSWTAAKRAAWLTVNASGTTPDTVRLSFNTAAMVTGSYMDTVVITAPAVSNSPVRITVSLSVADPRIGVLGSASVTIPPDDTLTSKLVIFDAGIDGGRLNWTVSAPRAAWLTANPSTGTTPDTLRLRANSAGLADGSYHDTLTITAPDAANSPYAIGVLLRVNWPYLDMNYRDDITLAPGDSAIRKIAIVSSIPNRPLGWTAATNSSRLRVVSASGSTPDTLRFMVNSTGLPEGSYRDTIVVTSSAARNSPFNVLVFLTVTRPYLYLSSTFQSVTMLPEDSVKRNVALTSSIPARQIVWSATTTSGRVAVTSPSGTTPDTVRLTIKSAGLAEGDYRDTVTITGIDAKNSPQRVVVAMTVRTPLLAVGTAFVTLALDDTVSQTVGISNNGGGTMGWTAAAPQASWYAISPTSGSATFGAASTLRVSFNSAGLAFGVYSDSILITAPGATGSPKYLRVTLSVARPTMSVRSTSGVVLTAMNFRGAPGSANPSSQTFRIWATGTSFNGPKGLDWSVSKSSGWLAVSPVSGSTKTTADVVVSVSGTGLAEGVYTDTIIVTGTNATGSPQNIVVGFTYSGPIIAVPPDTLRFSRNVASTFATTFGVGNAGGAPMTWAATVNAPWVTLSPTTATTNAGAATSVQASISTVGLDSGAYVATVTVTAPTASNSPRTFPIKLSVVPVRINDGTWSGTTEIDSTITFTIANNKITNISVGWKSPKVCLFVVDFRGTLTATPNLDVSQPTWGGALSDDITISGRYDSATTASGTVDVLIEYLEVYPGGVLRTCRSASTATWTATRQ